MSICCQIQCYEFICEFVALLVSFWAFPNYKLDFILRADLLYVYYVARIENIYNHWKSTNYIFKTLCMRQKPGLHDWKQFIHEMYSVQVVPSTLRPHMPIYQLTRYFLYHHVQSSDTNFSSATVLQRKNT